MFEALSQYFSLTYAAQKIDLEAWFQLVMNSVEEESNIEGISIPLAPPAEAQAVFHGVSGRDAIRAARPLYNHLLSTCRAQGIETINSLLDFGCGWGRFTRLLRRDVAEGGLYGVDPWPKALQMARHHFPHAVFVLSKFYPPLPFRDALFDVVFASSVFSHLPEHLSLAWICEICRILRPGGLLVATTHSVNLLQYIHGMKLGEISITSPWHQGLCASVGDAQELIERYHVGSYIYLETSGGDELPSGVYGDTFVPEAYIRRIWGNFMEVVDFVDDPTRLPQATFALRRK